MRPSFILVRHSRSQLTAASHPPLHNIRGSHFVWMRFAVGLMGKYISELHYYHSAHVNPNTTSLGHLQFDATAKSFTHAQPILKVITIKVGYDENVVIERVRPQPDACNLLSVKEIENAGKEAARYY